MKLYESVHRFLLTRAWLFAVTPLLALIASSSIDAAILLAGLFGAAYLSGKMTAIHQIKDEMEKSIKGSDDPRG